MGRQVQVIPPTAMLNDHGIRRKHNVFGYINVEGEDIFQINRHIKDFFMDVVSRYPNWLLVDVFGDTHMESSSTCYGMLDVIQAVNAKKCDILLVRAQRDLKNSLTNDIDFFCKQLFIRNIYVYFAHEDLHYFSPYEEHLDADFML